VKVQFIGRCEVTIRPSPAPTLQLKRPAGAPDWADADKPETKRPAAATKAARAGLENRVIIGMLLT
jgi:hypothetical protein